MATLTLTNLARETARSPSELEWDGTVEQDIERPTLEAMADAQGWEDVDTVGDLTQEQRRLAASGSIEGDADADEWSDLTAFIVIDAEGRLSQDLLESAIQLASNGNDTDGIQSTAEELLTEEFGQEQSENDVDTEVTLHSGGPTIITRQGSSAQANNQPSDLPKELQSLRSRAQSGGQLSVTYKTRRTTTLDTTDDRLAVINEHHSNIELQPGDVELFRDYAVHNLGPGEGMRKPLQFTEAALRKLGSDFQEGRTMNVHHNGERQVGTTFGATVERNTEMRGVEATWLAVDWYAPTLDASDKRLQDIRDMQTGVLRYTSIEFAGGEWNEQSLSASERPFFEIDVTDDGHFHDRLEAEGIARVGLGAVRGAGSS